MFATGGTPPPSKSEPPTTPVDRSKDQAHPIGAYYEGVLNGSKNYPDTKPELPPVTSQKYPTKLAPAESEAKSEPEKKEQQQQAEPEPSKPKQDDNVSSTPAPTPSEPTPKKEGEQEQPPVKQEKQKEEEKEKPPSATTTSAAPADEPELEPAKKADEKGDAEVIIAKAVTPEPVPAKRVRKPRELKKKTKDPKEAKEPKVVKSVTPISQIEKFLILTLHNKRNFLIAMLTYITTAPSFFHGANPPLPLTLSHKHTNHLFLFPI